MRCRFVTVGTSAAATCATELTWSSANARFSRVESLPGFFPRTTSAWLGRISRAVRESDRARMASVAVPTSTVRSSCGSTTRTITERRSPLPSSMILSTCSCRRFVPFSERSITTSFVIGAARHGSLEAPHWDSSTTIEFSPLAIVLRR
jgi:hypothetical protein